MCAGGKVRRALPLSSSVELSWVPSHTRLNPGQELSFIVALEAKVMWTIYKKYHWMSIQSFRLKVRISKGPASPERPLQQSVCCGVPRSGTDAQLNSGLGKKSDRPEAWVDKHLRCSEVVVRERGPAEGALPLCGGCESPAGLEVVVRSYALSGFDAFVTDSQDQLGQQLGLCCHLIGCQGDEKISVELLCTSRLCVLLWNQSDFQYCRYSFLDERGWAWPLVGKSFHIKRGKAQ